VENLESLDTTPFSLLDNVVERESTIAAEQSKRQNWSHEKQNQTSTTASGHPEKTPPKTKFVYASAILRR
jgi:hypothetical protein